jgi:hypothetical protein
MIDRIKQAFKALRGDYGMYSPAVDWAHVGPNDNLVLEAESTLTRVQEEKIKLDLSDWLNGCTKVLVLPRKMRLTIVHRTETRRNTQTT